MRLLAVFVYAVFCCAGASSVYADEFGPRFWAKAPAGLGEYTAPQLEVQNVAMDEITAEDLQKIMPAAGQEQSEKTQIKQIKEVTKK